MRLDAEAYKDISEQIKKKVRIAQVETAKAGIDIAQRLSSGPFSLAELAQIGHPFAKRHGAPQLNPSIINSQTGRFRDSWTIENEYGFPGGPPPTITNTDPVSRFLEAGTKTMFARPIDAEIVKRLDIIGKANLDKTFS